MKQNFDNSLKPSISIVVPCFNEIGNVRGLQENLLPVVLSLSGRFQVQVVFVDDGSTDGTWDALINAFGSLATMHQQFTFERHEENLGLGAALRTGIRAAHGSTLVTTDSDGTYAFDLIPEMIEAHTDQFDIVTASPYHPQGSIDGVPGYRLLLSRGSSLLYRILVDRQIYTYTSIFRVYRREVFDRVEFSSNGFLACAEILVKARSAGFNILDYPAVLHVRKYGVSKARLLRTIQEHLRFMSKVIMVRCVKTMRSPLRRSVHE